MPSSLASQLDGAGGDLLAGGAWLCIWWSLAVRLYEVDGCDVEEVACMNVILYEGWLVSRMACMREVQSS